MKLPPKPDIDLGIDGSILYTDIAAWEAWGRACAEAALKAAAKECDEMSLRGMASVIRNIKIED